MGKKKKFAEATLLKRCVFVSSNVYSLLGNDLDCTEHFYETLCYTMFEPVSSRHTGKCWRFHEIAPTKKLCIVFYIHFPLIKYCILGNYCDVIELTNVCCLYIVKQ